MSLIYYEQRSKGSGFMPPGRPKKWRERALGVLEGAVVQRIEGNMFEGREDNKNWLIKHLEVSQSCTHLGYWYLTM